MVSGSESAWSQRPAPTLFLRPHTECTQFLGSLPEATLVRMLLLLRVVEKEGGLGGICTGKLELC